MTKFNQFQASAIRTYASGLHASIAKIDDHEEAYKAVQATDDYLFQDIVDALANVDSKEEALQVLRSTIQQHEQIAAPGMAA